MSVGTPDIGLFANYIRKTILGRMCAELTSPMQVQITLNPFSLMSLANQPVVTRKVIPAAKKHTKTTQCTLGN